MVQGAFEETQEKESAYLTTVTSWEQGVCFVWLISSPRLPRVRLGCVASRLFDFNTLALRQ